MFGNGSLLCLGAKLISHSPEESGVGRDAAPGQSCKFQPSQRLGIAFLELKKANPKGYNIEN